MLVDYRLGGVGIEHLDDFYTRVGYRSRLDPGLLVHLGGAMDDEIVYISVWSSEQEARKSWEQRREDIEGVLGLAGPAASAARRSHSLHRLIVGDDIEEFREGLAIVDPDCVGFVIDLPGTDPKTYDLICRQMSFPEHFPSGLLLHAAGPIDGHLRVTSIWRRGGQSRRFLEDRLMPAAVEVVREHGLFPEIRPRELRVHLLTINNRLFD